MTEIKDTTVQRTAQLVYTLTTVPDMVVAGTTQVEVIVNAALPDPDATVVISAISIQFPLGDGENQLCHDTSDISAPSQMIPDVSTGAVQYLYQPDQPVQVGRDGLTFAFTQVTVNDKPGCVEIDVTEYESDGSPCPIVPAYVIKFPSAWGAISFWVDPANIPFTGATTLNWNGPAGPTYWIQYTDYDSSQVKTIPAANEGTYPADDQPPLKLTHTTNFTLNVNQTVNNQPYQWQFQQAVTVAAPQPTTSLSGSVDTTKSPRTINLGWTSTNTMYCMLNGDPHNLNPNVQNYAAAPAAIYTLTGVLPLADGTPLTGQSSLQLLYEVAGSFSATTGETATATSTPGPPSISMALAPDNSRLYRADGGWIQIFAPTSDDSAPLTKTGLYLASSQGWQYTWAAVSPDGSLLYVAAAIIDSSIQGQRNWAPYIQVFSTSTLTQIGSGVTLGSTLFNIKTYPDGPPIGGMAVCTGDNGSYLYVLVAGDPASIYAFSITGDPNNPLQPSSGLTLSGSPFLSMAGSPDGTQLLVPTTDKGGWTSLMVYSVIDNALNYVTSYSAPSGAIGLAIAPGLSSPAAVFDAQGRVTPFDFDTMVFGATSAPIQNLVNIAIAPDGSRIYAVDQNETIWALVPGEVIAG